jgi:hypothetical protein
MLLILCATCDQFVQVHTVEQHVTELHPEQEIIRLKTWPDGEPVVQLENELDIFFSSNE